ncbi:MAG: hypothetical protein LC708_02230 [Actinobacteria bacterium]|nr:hypothetical protein [Actinomycetota bacterium]
MLVTLLVSSLSVVGPAAPASAQPISGIQLSFGPGFPGAVTVGDQNRNAAILITNNSFGALGTVPVTISNIRLNPTCESGTASGVGEPCQVPEMRAIAGPIFNIDSPAVGRAGTACAGQIFTISPPDANGTVTFLGPAIVLGAPGSPTQSCIIDFTFDVLQRPLDGDTFAVANATASAIDPTTMQPVVVPVAGVSSAIVVNPFTPTIITQASVPGVAPTVPGPQVVTAGTAFQDMATVTGAPGAPAVPGGPIVPGPPLTGSVTFRLFRSDPANPGFPTCGEMPVQTSVVPVTPGPTLANGAPTATATFIPGPTPGPGRYVFVATYDEANTDPNYASVATPCADPNEQVRVNPILPSIAVEKTANPTVLNEPGGPVVFTVRVINTGPNALTLTSLVDNVYGDLNGRPAPAGGTPCVTAPTGSMPPTPPVLAANGGMFTCQFIGQVPAPGSGQPGPNHTDVVTAIGTDVNGNTATAMDDAVVTIVPVPPAVAITKTADPLWPSAPVPATPTPASSPCPSPGLPGTRPTSSP